MSEPGWHIRKGGYSQNPWRIVTVDEWHGEYEAELSYWMPYPGTDPYADTQVGAIRTPYAFATKSEAVEMLGVIAARLDAENRSLRAELDRLRQAEYGGEG